MKTLLLGGKIIMLTEVAAAEITNLTKDSDIPKRVFPEFNLWETDLKKSQRLKIINEEDFPFEEILNSLSLNKSPLKNSFGINDENEIAERLAVTKFLGKNPNLRKFLAAGFDNFELPIDPLKFMEFFDPRDNGVTPYWQFVNKFMSFLENNEEDLSSRLRLILETLKKTKYLQDEEAEMGKQIAKKVMQVSTFEGTVSFTMNITSNGEFNYGSFQTYKSWLAWSAWTLCGYKNYAYAISPHQMLKMPRKMEESKIAKYSGTKFLLKWVIKGYNHFRYSRACRDQVMDAIPKVVEQSITDYIRHKLRNIAYIPPEFSGGKLHVYFCYNEEGLFVKFYGLDISRKQEREERSQLELRNYPGLTWGKWTQMQVTSKKISKRAREAYARITRDKIYSKLQQASPGFFTDKFKIEDNVVNTDFSWFAIGNEYCSKKWLPMYRMLEDHREFVKKHLKELRLVSAVVDQLQQKAEELGKELCYPELLTDKHVVDFSKIYPVHLLSKLKPENIKSISLPALNGSMVALSGRHGGGKSSTQLTVVCNIYLAQSGLPVIGQSFSFNAKKVLGMVFITQKGDGSTYELLVNKTKAIFEGVENVNPTEVVLVLDEVGTGTQEISGLKVGKSVLTSLADKGVTVIFSSQITELIEYSRDYLGAECFWVDRDHGIHEGVSDGGVDELLQASGLQKFLN